MRAGGDVHYDWEWSNRAYDRAKLPWAPRWLVDLIGVDYFGSVTAVSLSMTESDAALVHVGRLGRLNVLTLDLSSLGDAGLAHLKGLANLSRLDLSGTHITDAGLVYLEGLASLSCSTCTARTFQTLGWCISRGWSISRGSTCAYSGQRRRARALEQARQSHMARPRPHSSLGSRAGAPEGALEPLMARAVLYSGFRRGADASRRACEPLGT